MHGWETSTIWTKTIIFRNTTSNMLIFAFADPPSSFFMLAMLWYCFFVEYASFLLASRGRDAMSAECDAAIVVCCGRVKVKFRKEVILFVFFLLFERWFLILKKKKKKSYGTGCQCVLGCLWWWFGFSFLCWGVFLIRNIELVGRGSWMIYWMSPKIFYLIWCEGVA